jgi:hypothetical protein
MTSLTNDERLNLKQMVGEMDSVDNTANIRKIKHSVLIRDDIRKLDTIRKSYTELFATDFDGFMAKCQSECTFLYNNYTDIFNRIIKDELDLDIMTRLLVVLKLIEDGKYDQHEGSAMVGKILKELYLDSAIKKLDSLNNANTDECSAAEIPPKNISWKEYKHKKA